jgi:hypothetical protein
MLPLLAKLPTPAAFVLALVLFHLLFTVLGLGATLILIPARLSKYVLVFAPLIGASIVSWLGWYSVSLGFPGTNTTATPICLVCCSLLLVRIFRARKLEEPIFNKEVLIASAIALCGALALSIPAMSEPGLTTVSAGNNDFASYALCERFLMLHSMHDQPGNLAQYLDLGRVVQPVFGVLFNSALAGSVLGLDSYRLQNVSIAAFVLWGALAFFALARALFKFPPVFAGILLAAYSVNESTGYLANHGFKSQLAAMAMVAAIFCFIVPTLGREGRPEVRDVAGATLLSWSIVVAYPHMLPAVFLPLAVYSVGVAVRAGSLRRLIWPCATGLFVLAAAVALAPARGVLVYRYALLMKDVVAGWFLPWISPAAFVGLAGTTAFAHLRWPFEALLGMGFVALVIAGLMRARRSEPDIFLVGVSILLVVCAAYGILIVSGRQEGLGLGGYKSYKLLSFFAPLFWCSALLVLREQSPHPLARRSRALLAVALVAGNLVAGGRLIQSVRENHASVPRAVAELTKLESDPRITSINLVSGTFWDGMWETTFLFHKPLYHLHPTYYPSRPLLGEWTLQDGAAPILTVEPCQRPQDVRLNERFVAVPNGSADLLASWDRGWHDDERTHRWTADTVASIRIRSRSRDRITIVLAYRALNAGNLVAVRLNGERLGDCSRPDRCEIPGKLHDGDNLLELVGALPPERPNNGDPRQLGIAFSRIGIAETGCGISSR